MNVPSGTMDALLVVKTSLGLISVPAQKVTHYFQTGRLVKVSSSHICHVLNLFLTIILINTM